MGFGVVLSHDRDGIISGSSALVSLSEKNVQAGQSILDPKAALHLSFDKGSSKQSYPSSLMGTIALIRQTYYDAKWYKGAKDANYNASLESLVEMIEQPQIFDVRDGQEVLRALKIGKEFNYNYIIKGKGDEYAWAKDIAKNHKVRLILPLNFPKPFKIKNLERLNSIELEKMKYWETAPYNAYLISKYKIPFSFTSHGQKTAKGFLKNLRKSVHKGGLDQRLALKALTENPAKWIGKSKTLGKLQKGFWANFIVTDQDLFKKKSRILENWVQGENYFKTRQFPDIDGDYKLTTTHKTFLLKIQNSKFKAKVEVSYLKEPNGDTVKIKNASAYLTEHSVSITFPSTKKNSELLYFSGRIPSKKGTVQGSLMVSKENEKHPSKLVFLRESLKKSKKKKSSDKHTSVEILYPNKAYGQQKLLQSQNIIIRNATVWTNEKSGVLEHTDVYISGGKIKKIGKKLKAPTSALEIDGTGKYLTSGIIDEHSHIAISKGVNEGSHNTSAEVRIGDVINAEDVNIYRHLAGGVTSAQLLHGSANPIGGQSALIKLRWGRAPEDMKIKASEGFIKFALGENVKQSNWGDHMVVRFPQTRMGVEQTYVNAFTQALEYRERWKQYRKTKKNKPRKNLRLETLVEILEGKRFITCHSYVQSEINMLMHVADRFGFKINTFTHILEGYKVSDKMKKHGVGASTFSDWWIYKYEVLEAIPYNAAMMNQKGLVVAINSDDAEMGRRLNQEAAKAMKYGSISAEDAWKMITLNPAKLLHLDHRMGSIKKGKDADVVLWSGNPLSMYSKAEKTIIDGVIYFDLDEDLRKRKKIKKEKLRIAEKMFRAESNGSSTKTHKPKKKVNYHCGDL